LTQYQVKGKLTTQYKVILIWAIIAGSIGTGIGFGLAILFAHQGGIALLLADFLILPFFLVLLITNEADKSPVFWLLFGVLQLTYYLVLVWLLSRAVSRLRPHCVGT
jgi:hypothetical protein